MNVCVRSLRRAERIKKKPATGFVSEKYLGEPAAVLSDWLIRKKVDKLRVAAWCLSSINSQMNTQMYSISEMYFLYNNRAHPLMALDIM